jgi:hypothetical protein
MRRQRAASEIRLAAGGFDYGGHGLHHGSTTLMPAGPNLSRTRLDLVRQFFLFLKISLSYWWGTADT